MNIQFQTTPWKNLSFGEILTEMICTKRFVLGLIAGLLVHYFASGYLTAHAACTTTIIPPPTILAPPTIIVTCTPDPTSTELLRNRDIELQRAIILGNPPKPQRAFVAPQRPDWVTRPEAIPESYPHREQDGQAFL